MNLVKSHERQVFCKMCKQFIIHKVLLAFSFHKMFSNGQNSKQLHVRYSFDEVSSSWIGSSRYTLCLISNYMKEIHCFKT